MNPESGEQLPPPPQPQPHLKATSCPRHPDEQFTGFCPSCLCERLAVLDKSSSSSTSSTIAAGRKSASSAIKSLFKGTATTSTNADNNGGSLVRGRPSSSSFLPELRRTKSFSGGKNEGGLLGVGNGAFEPQRKSCDVRGRSTLFALFSQDDVKRHVVTEGSVSSVAPVAPELKGEVVDHVFEEGVQEEEEEEFHDSNDNGDEIQVVEEEFPQSSCNLTNNINNSSCLVDDFSNNNDDDRVGNCSGEMKLELKPMKDHIDLDSQNKKVGSKDLKELAGSFWSAASVFSKKLRAWTKKNNSSHQKMKKGSQTVKVNGKKGNAGRSCRDTQSEIADYGFGRRSCDTDPRFSLDAGRFSVDAAMAGRFSVDAGRMSFDDVRCSFDEPRASWDGYLIGGSRPFPRMILPMVSVVENAPAPILAPGPAPMVSRKDAQIPVEEPRRSSVSINGDEPMPGNAAQTKDYYSDSSSKKRSLDRSSSIRKTAAAVVAEMDEMKSNECCNAKITPTPTTTTTSAAAAHGVDVDYLQGTKVVASCVDRDFRDFDLLHSHSHHSHSQSQSQSQSHRDDYSGSFDMGYSRDNASVLGSHHCDHKGSKKSRRWRAWNIWGLLYRKGNTKDVDVDVDDDDRYSRSNGVERSYSESWNGDPRAGFSRNMLCSNSSVSWRDSFNNTMGGPVGGSIRKGSGCDGGTIDSNTNGRKKKEEFVLERNRSARYSPSHGDNGMLRFYLTPMRGSRRGSSVKPKPAYSHSFARSVLRLY